MLKKTLTAAAISMAALSTATTAIASDKSLRICAADNDLPYTAADDSGLEDQIGALLGRQLGVTVEKVRFADPRYVVRDGIDKGSCDVMLGADSGDPRLQTTSPYYRSSYVFLTRSKDGLNISNWDDPTLQKARIGVIPGTPAETMLRQIGRYSESFRYLMSLGGNRSMRNRFVRYDTEKLVKDLASGEIDVAVAWAPSVARYVKSSTVPLVATPVPQSKRSDGEPVVFDYETAVGVRKDNDDLRERIESALTTIKPEIDKLLESEGLPTLTPDLSPSMASQSAAEQAAGQPVGGIPH